MPSPPLNEKSGNLPENSRPQTPLLSRPQTPRAPEIAQSLSIVQRRTANEDGLRLVHGVTLPPGMADPKQDGYRTPTGEDFERHFHKRQKQVMTLAPSQGHTGGHLPSSRPGSAGRSHLSLSALSEKVDETIHWKQRMRHFTWNFFSMTMATGGIANVIKSGKLLHCAFDDQH